MVAFGYAIFNEKVCSKVNSQYQLLFFPSAIDFVSFTRRDKIAKDLAKIFSEWGFVQVVNHGVKTEVIDAMQTQAKKFFDLPLEQKEKAKLTRPGGSSTNEGFGYGVDSGFFYVGRPWIDRFQKSMEDYNKSLDKLTIQILELCAEGLGLKSSTFTEPYLGTAGDCIARFNYYPPCPLPSLTLGLGAHTDPNLLTILHQCSVGGLQICHGHGSWFSVKPSPNSFIINVGDSFEAWTNGRFKSVKHRAVVNETQSRLSIVYFSNPLPHSIMSVPHKLIDCEHPLEFRPAFTWLDYKTHLLETHKKNNNNNNNNNDGGRTSKLWLLRRKSILNQKVK
ncbi:unnamed protein product [Sphagnum troendelagicum]|uniref:Fe2OG dioxygenase domain-containing protein n=1 Tax=Sphagnum troendelagicum TaxID=128251 RepID=A0ABP0U7D5_9BRYO